MNQNNGADKDVVTIKKYANRRLYNTATSSYVTLDYLSQMVRDGIEFIVVDAKTGEDLTRSVLTQIIVEEESKGGQNLLPIAFLRHLISFYGDSLQGLVPRYLEHTMHSFAQNQEQMRQYMRDTLQGISPFSHFEEMGKQNMTVFENAMKMFSPFYDSEHSDGEKAKPADGQKDKKNDGRAQSAESGGSTDQAHELNQLREQLNQMQQQLENMLDPSQKG